MRQVIERLFVQERIKGLAGTLKQNSPYLILLFLIATVCCINEISHSVAEIIELNFIKAEHFLGYSVDFNVERIKTLCLLYFILVTYLKLFYYNKNAYAHFVCELSHFNLYIFLIFFIATLYFCDGTDLPHCLEAIVHEYLLIKIYEFLIREWKTGFLSAKKVYGKIVDWLNGDGDEK